MAAGYGRRAGTGEQSLCVTARLLATLQNSPCLRTAENRARNRATDPFWLGFLNKSAVLHLKLLLPLLLQQSARRHVRCQRALPLNPVSRADRQENNAY